MLFSSSVFLFAFFPAVLLGYFVVFRGHRIAQNRFLLVASLLFYAWGEPWFVLVMMASILANYLFGLWAHHWRRKGYPLAGPVAAAVVCNLGLLFVFKYLTFTLKNLGLLGFQVTIPVIELPIGISFFTFQALSYVLDVAMGRGAVQRSPFNLGLYISFFPQLIAGPIVKYSTVAQEILDRKETWDDFARGTCRFVVGLGKKVLLSNQLAIVADAAFNAGGGEISTPFAWLGSLCYILQLYYDFSGYSDMAIGLGRIFGFHFLENFNYPYAATSITNFWQRWHISLATWFRDYLYIPLGGSRTDKKWKKIRNLLVVWLLTGVWHGANWTFICWGLFFFVCLAVEKGLDLERRIPKFFRWVYTIFLFNFSCVIFRAADLGAAWAYLKAMFGSGGAPVVDLTRYYLWQYGVVLVLAVLFALPIARWLSEHTEVYLNRCAPYMLPMWGAVYSVALLLLLLASAAFLVKGTYNPFIYFNF